MSYIELYYADDYSLAELQKEFGVSRQAVYDNIKRTEKILEDYEMKLHIFHYIVRRFLIDFRTLSGRCFSTRAGLFYQALTIGSDYEQSGHLSRNTLQTISAGKYFLLDYRLSRLMISPKAMQRFSAVEDIQMGI